MAAIYRFKAFPSSNFLFKPMFKALQYPSYIRSPICRGVAGGRGVSLSHSEVIPVFQCDSYSLGAVLVFCHHLQSLYTIQRAVQLDSRVPYPQFFNLPSVRYRDRYNTIRFVVKPLSVLAFLSRYLSDSSSGIYGGLISSILPDL